MEEPKVSQVMAKALLELLGIVLLLLPLAYVYIFAAEFEPFHRGFFCDDLNLRHPYTNQTVPILAALLIWVALAIFFIVLVENLRTSALEGVRRKTPIPGSRYPPWIAVELYRYFGYFALGASGCLLFTELAKYTVGRLRPHFLTLCQPDLARLGGCKDQWGYSRFVIEKETEVCLGLVSNGGNITEKQLHEARLSFLSGHSSFSFYCSTFLIVYLQARLTNLPTSPSYKWIQTIYWTLKIFRPFLQFGMISLAFWISLTRISDYYHHPYDVATGALVGIMFGIITLLVMADVFNKHSAFFKSLEMEQPVKESDRIVWEQPRQERRREGSNIPYIDSADESQDYGHKKPTSPKLNQTNQISRYNYSVESTRANSHF